MKRLNFEHLTAETSSMNKVDPFFILILVLISGLAVTYKSAQYDLGDVHLQAAINRQLQKKIKTIELKQKEFQLSQLKAGGKRSIASLGPTRFELDPAKIAESLYQQAADQCIESQKQVACLDQIDALVTQFPTSKWAGKSLVLLTIMYIKNKKYKQAGDLVKIVRAEFRNEVDVIRQLKEVEKSHL